MAIRDMRGKWQCRFQINGVQYAAITGLAATERNRRKAEAFEAAARAKVLMGGSMRVQTCGFSDGVRAWLDWLATEKRPATARRLAVSATSLTEFLGRLPVASVIAGRIEDYKAWRRRDGIKEVTLGHDLRALNSFLQYARKQNWLAGDPFAQVKIPSGYDAVRMYVLTPDEEELYFRLCRECRYMDLHDLGRLMLLQGCRPGELLALEQNAVDLFGARLAIVSGKTAAARRQLALVRESLAILARRLAQPGRWVFPSPRCPGEHLNGLQRPHNAILAAMGRTKGEGFVLYAFRHTFATRAGEAGMPLPVLAAILGHSGLRTVGRYVHPGQQAMDEAMRRYGQPRTAQATAGNEEASWA